MRRAKLLLTDALIAATTPTRPEPAGMSDWPDTAEQKLAN